MSTEFDPKGMPFRRLGSSGLRVPLLSLGAWLTLGGSVKGDPVKDIIKVAFENGINMIDTAEAYARGESEKHIGRALKELGYRRTDLVITTKLFWGLRRGPNDGGLSRKHIIEGTKESLERLQVDYVDVIFAHRPDPTVPMEEVVRAFNWVIEKGWAFYWGTSEWSAREIEEAFHVAHKYNLVPPIAEQCKHHMFHRERPEKEYEPLYRRYDYGTTVFSGLAQGLLTGKYNDGLPADSRFATEKEAQFDTMRQWLQSPEGQADIAKVRELSAYAEKELNCKVQHLALAWLCTKQHTSTVILGASKPEQVLDNLKALEVIPKLTPDVLEKIEEIIGTKPKPLNLYGRFPLDGHLPKI
ncbi:voltage-dependent potassium channel subunit beta [Phanerochaete sordida]|uniref:Voltage-dependent potassium channel subunit beta n=1 Tax=Phanerochaete sordida TaxID=48140 RepID=A0A9P3GHR6_9APHY|nr:voltage-dependent potassium channel subunit beta [Phanerochaete sordida]